MSTLTRPRVSLLIAAAALLAPAADAADVVKGNNTTALNAAGSWAAGVLPTSSDVAVWDSTVLAANTSLLGADLSWQGVKILSPGGAVIIGASATNTLTLGTGGIDMSAATQNLTILSNLTAGAAQTWNVAAGRTLQIQNINTTTRLSGSGNITLARTGSGTAYFTFNPGASGSTAFTDQQGFYNYTGNWTIGDGVFVKTLRNGRNAWGSGTITLAGGTVAQHQNFSGTWSNNIILQDGTTSTIDDANSSGARTLKLLGAISGSGNLNISETGAASHAKNGGVVIVTNSTLSGSVTINGGAVLRVGGLYGASDVTLVAGTTGDLGTASVTINSLGALTLSRSNTWTFGNSIAGSGTLYVGGATGALVSGANTQVVTLTGTNTFSGGTELVQGTLSVADMAKIGSGYLAVKGGAVFEYSGTGSESTSRNLFLDNGAATINITSATGVLSWSDGSLKGGGSGALITKAGAGTLVLSGAISSGGTTAVTVSGGTLRLSGTNTYTGTSTISSGATLEISGAGSLASTTAVALGGTLSFTTSANQTLSSAVTGLGALSMGGSGILTLSSTGNSYTGGTSVSSGTLALGLAGVLADTGSVTVSGGALDISTLSETIGALSLSGGSVTGTSGTLTTSGITANVASGTATLGALTAGAGSLSKSGNGTLSLTKAAAHSGGTTVSAGTLSLGASDLLADAGSLTLSGGTLALGSNNETVGALSISAGSITGSGTLTSNTSFAVSNTTAAGASSISAKLSGSAGLTKTGNGTLTLSAANDYSGATTVSAGKLVVATGGSIASSSIVLANGSELETVDGLTVGAGRTLSLGSGLSVASATHTGALTLSGGTLNIDFGASANDVLAVAGDLTLASGSIAFTSTGTYGNAKYTFLTYSGTYTSGSVTLSGLSSDGTSRQTFGLFNDTTLKAIQLDVSGQAQNVAWTGAAGSTWDAGSAATASWSVTDAGYAGDQASRFFNGDAVTFGDAASTGTVTIGAANLTPATVAFTADTIDYTLGSSGGVIAGGSIAKSGAATLTIGMANSYAGGTTLSAGRLRLGADGALGSGLVTVSGGRLSSDGASARSLPNNVRFAADVSLGDATDSGALTFSGGIDLAAAAPRTLTLDSDVVVTGAISNGSLTKSGNGKLTLSGANSLGVDLTVASGAVALGAAGVISDVAAVSVSSGATLDLAGYSEAVGSLNLASGSTVTAGSISGGTVTLTDNVTFGATLTGSSALVKNGSFAMTLAAASARTGATTLNAGSILVGDATALGNGSLNLNGGTLAMSDATARTVANNITVGGDATLGAVGTGAMTLGGTVGLGGQTRTLTAASNATISGIISNGSLTKAGNGALTLSAANTLTNTVVSSGALVATNASAFGTTGSVTLNDAATGASNATLSIDPTAASITVARAITVANQGTGTATIGGASAATSANSAVFSGAITLAKDVTLSTANVSRTDFSGGISGAGNVTISTSGSGTRVIFVGANANTYTGGTTINAGSTLQLSDGTATATSFIPDASVLTVNGTLNLAKGANTETVGGLAGSGTVQGHPAVNSIASSLTVNSSADHTFAGTLANGGATGSTFSLVKQGTGTLTLSGTLSYTGNTTVTAGKLRLTGNATVGSALLNAVTDTAAEVDFGANVLTIGTATASNQFYYGKLTGTGTLQLRGGSLTIQNADGTTTGTGANYQIWTAATAQVQAKSVQFFALDTGASATNRKDFGFINDTGDALNLSSLSGYGAIRNDAGGTNGQTVVRQIIVEQQADTVFNGALLSHRSSNGAIRAVSLTKRGNGTLELAGFVGKATTSSQAGAAGGVALTVEAGVLKVTNAYNTTTTNTAAIDLGVVTVTGGTLAFANQALLNTAGSAGATRVDMNGGTLQWLAGNTQDLSVGGRLKLLDGKVATLDTNGNDVTLGTAFALGASGTAGLTKLGNGALTLNAANTFTGAVTVSAGSLVVGDASALGTGAVAVSGGALNLGGLAATNAVTYSSGSITGASAYAGALTVAGGTLAFADLTTFGTAAITVGAGATLDINFLNPTNAITLNGGTLLNYGSWNGGVTLAGTVDAALINSLAANEVTVTTGSTVDLAGVTKDIVFAGGTLNNLGSYTGMLTVQSSLDLSAGLPSSDATIKVGAGGAVNFGNNAFAGSVEYTGGSISNYAGPVTVVGTGVALAAGSLGTASLVVGTGATVTIGAGFDNAIRMDGGSVTGETLNNFSGTITVAAGKTFDIDGADSLAVISSSAAVVVEDGATLKGSGALGQVTVQSGGVLAPGNSPGLLSLSALTLAVDPIDGSAGSMAMEIAAVVGAGGGPLLAGADHDSVAVSGALDLSHLSSASRFLLNLATLSEDGVTPGAARGWDPAVDFELVLFTYGNLYLGANTDINQLFTVNSTGFLDGSGHSVTANHFHVVDDVATQQVRLAYSSVPEPSTYGVILGGLALAAAAIRRRKVAPKSA